MHKLDEMMTARRYMTMMLSAFLMFAVFTSWAEAFDGGESSTRLSEAGIAGFQQFTAAEHHRAFAIAPGGVWAWVSGHATTETAEAEALKACRQYTQQPCHVYAVNDQVVFDENTWLTSWKLNTTTANLSDAAVGLGRGQRFPDLALTSPEGRPVALGDLRGKPVFLHFWGSWCPPCKAEFADLQNLYDALAGDDIISFVFVQGREPIAKSKRWADKNGFNMPLYDSGHQGRGDKAYRLADRETIADRRLAAVYPSTYVLDADGLVVFHQSGPGVQWGQYENLIRYLASNVTQ